MPRKLSPEEAAVMIIRRRLRQMEEDKMAKREADAERSESDLTDSDLAGSEHSGPEEKTRVPRGRARKAAKN